MSRRFKRDPSYRLHKQSGQGIVTLSDGLGSRKDVLLGPYGTPESKAEYRHVLAEWEANGRRLVQPKQVNDITINELMAAFWPHAERHYRKPDGTPTSEQRDYKQSLRPLKRMYGHTAAAAFGPLALKAVRQSMIDGSWMTPHEKAKRAKNGRKVECSRRVVNQRVGRIRRMFKWAAENELVEVKVYQSLMTVAGLERGRSSAQELAPVKPVDPAIVENTLPHMRPQVAAMVQLQRHAGMRPGEVVIMRGCDLDMSGKVWLYRPGSEQADGEHKTAHLGHAKVVPLGPKAQGVLRPWLRLNLTEFLFSPWESVRDLHSKRTAERKTPGASRSKRKAKPKRKPRSRYSVDSYGKSVRRACLAAGAPHWHLHQLRHTKALEIKRAEGLDAARSVLGHRSPVITEHYAGLDMQKATEVAERLG